MARSKLYDKGRGGSDREDEADETAPGDEPEPATRVRGKSEAGEPAMLGGGAAEGEHERYSFKAGRKASAVTCTAATVPSTATWRPATKRSVPGSTDLISMPCMYIASMSTSTARCGDKHLHEHIRACCITT